MAGPCAVESAESIERIAAKVKAAGASILRGGSYKPRTSPYSFQGIGPEGIGWLKEAGRRSGMPVISELVSEKDIDLFVGNVDIIQIGARNMQNFALLKAVGRTQRPVLLKRGAGATVDEWIMAAEYVLAEGNPNVVLCERGIRTFEYATRNTMDLAVVPIIKEKTHLPIVVDPSHATGNWKYVEAVSLAAIAAGADGLLIEVHDDPDAAASDGMQSIKPERFAELMEKARLVAKAVGREL
jgi:3-deoxy-7-phosphoheptulonate synthase